MESSKRDNGTAFVYQRLGWEVRDGSADTLDPQLKIPLGAEGRVDPPLIAAAIKGGVTRVSEPAGVEIAELAPVDPAKTIPLAHSRV